MEQVILFDEELKKIYKNEFQMKKIGCVFMSCFAILSFFLPIQLDLFPVVASQVMLLDLTVSFYLSPYMQIQENGKTVSIYQKLKWLPVKASDIQAVRREYLKHACLKMLPPCMILQQIGGLLDESWSILNLLYPAVLVGIVWLLELLSIYHKH